MRATITYVLGLFVGLLLSSAYYANNLLHGAIGTIVGFILLAIFITTDVEDPNQ